MKMSTASAYWCYILLFPSLSLTLLFISSGFCFPGEGFHNYHHTFPFDYSASELGLKFNPTTWFIDLMFWLGLVTERKQAPKEMIKARRERTGDGTSWETNRLLEFRCCCICRLYVSSLRGASVPHLPIITKVVFFIEWWPNSFLEKCHFPLVQSFFYGRKHFKYSFIFQERCEFSHNVMPFRFVEL